MRLVMVKIGLVAVWVDSVIICLERLKANSSLNLAMGVISIIVGKTQP